MTAATMDPRTRGAAMDPRTRVMLEGPIAPTLLRLGLPNVLLMMAQAASGLNFRRVTSVEELDQILSTADRPVMLDFYADWCVACKEMERFTFSDAGVQARLGKALLLKADVTANTAQDKALLQRFQLFGPPGTIFFDAQGKDHGVRAVGFEPVEEFVKTLEKAGL